MNKLLILTSLLLIGCSDQVIHGDNTTTIKQYYVDQVTCKSTDYEVKQCAVNIPYLHSHLESVTITRVYNNIECEMGINWDINDRVIKVWDNCQATFQVKYLIK